MRWLLRMTVFVFLFLFLASALAVDMVKIKKGKLLQGQIVEEGTPSELAAGDGWFARLARSAAEVQPQEASTDDGPALEDGGEDDDIQPQ